MKERLLDGEMVVFSNTQIWCLKTEHLPTKKVIIKEYRHRPFTKTNLKCIVELNVKDKTIKLMEDNLGINVYNLGYGNNILDRTQKALGFPDGSVVKNLPANAGATGDLSLIPGSERSPGEGNGNPLQNSCQINPVDRGPWWARVHGITKSQTWLSN